MFLTQISNILATSMFIYALLLHSFVKKNCEEKIVRDTKRYSTYFRWFGVLLSFQQVDVQHVVNVQTFVIYLQFVVQ